MLRLSKLIRRLEGHCMRCKSWLLISNLLLRKSQVSKSLNQRLRRLLSKYSSNNKTKFQTVSNLPIRELAVSDQGSLDQLEKMMVSFQKLGDQLQWQKPNKTTLWVLSPHNSRIHMVNKTIFQATKILIHLRWARPDSSRANSLALEAQPKCSSLRDKFKISPTLMTSMNNSSLMNNSKINQISKKMTCWEMKTFSSTVLKNKIKILTMCQIFKSKSLIKTNKEMLKKWEVKVTLQRWTCPLPTQTTKMKLSEWIQAMASISITLIKQNKDPAPLLAKD